MFRTACLACQSSRLTELIDLGMHPCADTFIPAEKLSEPDLLYPLMVDACQVCGQVQTRTEVPPAVRYVQQDYSYTSGNSATSRAHWTAFAEEVSQRVGLSPKAFVLEIGSNDGFLAEQFQQRGCQVLGVEPSPHVAAMADLRKVPTIRQYFSTELIACLPVQPQLIVANNVLNHMNDPLDVLTAVKILLAPGGTFVFEVPDWTRLVVSGSFDQIYHEHVTYWTRASAVAICHRVGLVVTAIEPVDYHGGSLRVYVQHRGTAVAAEEPQLTQEDYALWRAQVERQRKNFWLWMADRYDRQPLVCVGAAAKANTFLNYYKLDRTLVRAVTDASPSKIGKWTPGTRIPIARDQILARLEYPLVLLTAWNLAEALQRTLSAINPSVQYLNPYAA